MNWRPRLLFAAFAILLMVLPPVFDTFDTWDKQPELPLAGHNTETTLVIVCANLTLGAVVAWLSVLSLNWLASLARPFRAHLAQAVLQARACGQDHLLLLYSPPPRLASLRI